MATWREAISRCGALALGIAAASLVPPLTPHFLDSPAIAGNVLEERKLPMKFAWNACAPDCAGWVSAVGIVTAETPALFDEFAKGRDLVGSAIVLDSSGGSVNDALALGRRWRALKATTSVGTPALGRDGVSVRTDGYCESMCVFLLLAGVTRYVPEEARVRVHQIWMGDRAENARAATYTAQDLTIVERDIGRLVKYTFDMGGTGDLVALALSVPPWEDLHRLSQEEIQAANLVTTQVPPPNMPGARQGLDTIAASTKLLQDRFAGEDAAIARPTKPTQTAEAHSGSNAPVTPPAR